MEPTDATIEILKSIRDEMRGMRADLNERIDQTNVRLDRVVQEQIRQATAIIELVHGQERHERILERHEQLLERHEQALVKLIDEVHGLGTLIDNMLTSPLGEQVREHGQRLASLDQRMTSLEQRLEP
jgi:predicted KAP-like P-loop ATPase